MESSRNQKDPALVTMCYLSIGVRKLCTKGSQNLVALRSVLGTALSSETCPVSPFYLGNQIVTSGFTLYVVTKISTVAYHDTYM